MQLEEAVGLDPARTERAAAYLVAARKPPGIDLNAH
jgi:hypothetical protein